MKFNVTIDKLNPQLLKGLKNRILSNSKSEDSSNKAVTTTETELAQGKLEDHSALTIVDEQYWNSRIASLESSIEELQNKRKKLFAELKQVILQEEESKKGAITNGKTDSPVKRLRSPNEQTFIRSKYVKL